MILCALSFEAQKRNTSPFDESSVFGCVLFLLAWKRHYPVMYDSAFFGGIALGSKYSAACSGEIVAGTISLKKWRESVPYMRFCISVVESVY